MHALAMQLQTNKSNGITMFWKKVKRSSLFRWRNIERTNVFLIKNIFMFSLFKSFKKQNVSYLCSTLLQKSVKK